VSGFRVDEGISDADVVGGADRVSVGRGVAGGGSGVAGGSRGPGPGVVRSGAVDGVPGMLAAGGRGDGPVGDQGWSSDDRDGDVCAVDGPQDPVSVGVSVAGGGGVGLDSSAAVLSDQPVGAGAGRVDGPEADAADRRGDGERVDAHAGGIGGPGEAVSPAGGPGRFDGDRGRREVSDRRRPGVARRPGARAGGPEARCVGRGAQAAGAGPIAVDGSQAAGGESHDPSALRGGQERGALR
jgi:hypothetical protein